MVTGLYAAARGMIVQLEKQSVYANNLANANSAGYRRECLAQVRLPTSITATPQYSGGILVTQAVLDMRPGPVQETGNPLDIALHGPGLLTVQTPQGTCYTRNGQLTLNSNKELVTPQGYPVLGQAGPITLPPGNITISEDGTIFVGGQQIDRLAIVEFTDPTVLRKLGGNLMQASVSPAPAQSTTVTQGSLEGSNVRVMAEMAAMMRGLRTYEANATALQQQDTSTQSLIQRVTGAI